MLSLKNINYRYKKNENDVIKNVTYDFLEKPYILTGINGVGKTTLLNLIGGIFTPDTGEITVDNKKIDLFLNVAKLDNQDIESLGEIDVYVYLRYLSNLFDYSYDELKAIAERIRLTKNKRIKELSKGNKRKLLLLPIILSDAKILLFDEPFDNIDSETVKIIYDLILEKANNRTVIIVSHIENPGFINYQGLKLVDGELYEV